MAAIFPYQGALTETDLLNHHIAAGAQTVLQQYKRPRKGNQ